MCRCFWLRALSCPVQVNTALHMGHGQVTVEIRFFRCPVFSEKVRGSCPMSSSPPKGCCLRLKRRRTGSSEGPSSRETAGDWYSCTVLGSAAAEEQPAPQPLETRSGLCARTEPPTRTLVAGLEGPGADCERTSWNPCWENLGRFAAKPSESRLWLQD